jgi:hypothetical protein
MYALGKLAHISPFQPIYPSVTDGLSSEHGEGRGVGGPVSAEAEGGCGEWAVRAGDPKLRAGDPGIMSNNMDRLHDGRDGHRDTSNRDSSRDSHQAEAPKYLSSNRDGHHHSSNRDGHHSSNRDAGHHSTSSNRDGHHSSSSNRHGDGRAKTSCSAPAQSRSPSAHRSRSVSAALRQAGSPVKTQSRQFRGYRSGAASNYRGMPHLSPTLHLRPRCSPPTPAARG